MELKDKNYNEKEDMASIFDSWAETTYQGGTFGATQQLQKQHVPSPCVSEWGVADDGLFELHLRNLLDASLV